MIQTLNVELLRKIEALTHSPVAGESASAKARLTEILGKHGKTMADLPELLNPSTPRPRDMFRDFEDWMEQKEPGYKARSAADRAAREKKEAVYRAAVIAKYGSEKAAKA